jgi:hypothetical protein
MIGASSFTDARSTLTLLIMKKNRRLHNDKLDLVKRQDKTGNTQLMRTYFGRLVFGSLTLQNAYIILQLFKSSASSVIPPSR